MANELKITDIVDESALKQVETLNSELLTLKATYAQIAIELGKQIKVPVADYQSLSTKANTYQTTLVQLSKTVQEMNAVQQKQVSLLNEVNNKMKGMNAAQNLANVFGKLADGVDKLNDLLDKLVKNHQQAAQAIGQLGSVTGQVNQQFAQVTVNYTQLSETIEGYSDDIANSALNLVKLQERLSLIKSQMDGLKDSYSKGTIGIEEYQIQMAELKLRYNEVNAEIKTNQNIIRNHSAAVVAAKGSYDQMNQAMLELQKRYKALSAEDRGNGVGDDIIRQAAELNEKLKEIDAKFGNYQRNVGNYASAFNGLGYQVMNVVRELPALNSGFNTFMIAIGNNLPMLVDEIDRARKLNADLAKDGHTTVPVWKQVTGAIFNWQTALVVGLTLITMYWKDIAKFFKELINGKEAYDGVAEAQERYNKAVSEGHNNASSEVSELRVLYKASQDHKRSLEDRIKAVDALRRKYPDYLDSFSNEEVLAGKAASSYDKLSKELVKTARARAVMNEITKMQADLLKVEDEKAKAEFRRNQYAAISGNGTRTEFEEREYTSMGARLKVVEEVKTKWSEMYNSAVKDAENAQRRIEEINRGITNLMQRIDVGDIIDDTEDKVESTSSKERDILEELLQTRIDLIEDERERELEQNRKDYEKKKEGLKAESELYRNYDELMRRNEAEINAKYDEEERKAREEALKRLQEEAEREVDIVGDKYAMRALKATQGLQKELEALSEEYAKGLIDAEEYEEKRAKLTNEYAVESAQLGIEMVRKQLETENMSAEKRMELQQALIEAENALKDAVIASNEEQAKAREEALAKAREGFEALRDVADESVEGMGDLMDGLYSIFEAIEKGGKDTFAGILAGAIQMVSGIKEMVSGMYESQIEELEKEEEANEEAKEKELERIDELAEHGAISEEEAEARKRAAEDKTAAKSAEIEKKKAELMTKQAKFEKAMNISQTIMATSLAVTKALPNLLLAALVGAMGAVQLATIIAQPIPKYAKGTKDHKGGLAIVGDGGKREGVITEKGLWITPDSPTLIDLPKHAMVIPDISKYTAAKGLSSDLLNKRDARNEPVVVNVENDYTRLEREMMGNRGELRKLTKVVKKMSRASELRGIYGRL